MYLSRNQHKATKAQTAGACTRRPQSIHRRRRLGRLGRLRRGQAWPLVATSCSGRGPVRRPRILRH